MNTALIVAAGSSSRMGTDKLCADLAGHPVLWHSIRAFDLCPDVESILIVTRPDRLGEVRGLCAGFPKVTDILEGGAQRQDSVWNGLAALPSGTRLVAVHDGARPLVTPSLISECFLAAEKFGAVSCAAPVVDTLKKADGDGCITGGVDRTGLWSMQTPQVFDSDLLKNALRAVMDQGGHITDETSAVEQFGETVRLLHNPRMNLKVTFPADLALAEAVLQARSNGDCLL